MRDKIPLPLRLALYEVSPGRRVRWRRFPGLESLDAAAGEVVLTFDDGPTESTPALLEVLREHGLGATFFVLGEQLERWPDLGRAIVDDGHELALHGYRHFRHDKAGAGASRTDIERGLQSIRDVAGVSPRWYRAPHGKFSEEGFATCRSLGLSPVYWSAWGHDWEPVSEDHIRRIVRRDLGDGAIVLLHDSVSSATVRAIPLLAEDLAERRLAAVTLDRAAPA